MPTYRVTLADRKTGKEHFERIVAADIESVFGKINVGDYVVGKVESIDETEAGVYEDGSGYERTATIAAVASILFIPCVLAALILSGLAFEKSSGKRGLLPACISILSVAMWTAGVIVLFSVKRR